MTNGGRKAGAVLSLIGGGLFAFWVVMALMAYIMSSYLMILGIAIMFLIWTISGVVGGILLLKDNWLGGFFPLLSGTTLLLYFFTEFQLPDGSFLTMGGGPIEAMLLLALLMCLVLIIGGILGLVFKAEEGES